VPYTILKEVTFAAAHFIPGHRGPCKNLHGHNYRIRVFLRAATLDALGMVLDFADLKQQIGAVTDRFDHQVINEVPPFDRIVPTAELLAEHIFRGLAGKVASPRIEVARVEVWETDRSCAAFEAD